jgi:teichuronic acid biosynthesis glycosyltransferase TuaG
MAAYQAERFVGEAIDSVLKQTYPNWELIVVNDGSSDNTEKVIKEKAKADARIRYFARSESGGGPAPARNLALAEARGEYIAFLDSDDVWLPEKLFKQMNTMIRGEYDFCFTGFRRMTEDGTKLGRALIPPRKVDYDSLLSHNMIGTLTVVVKKSVLGDMRMQAQGHEDFILWLDLLKRGVKSYGIQEDLARYRIVGNSVSSNKLKAAGWRWTIYRRIQRLPLSRTLWHFSNYVVRVTYKYSRF